MGNKQPNWSRLERERFRRDMENYESQLSDDDPKRCEECNKVMGDEEQCQRICEICSAGVPCEGEDWESERVYGHTVPKSRDEWRCQIKARVQCVLQNYLTDDKALEAAEAVVTELEA